MRTLLFLACEAAIQDRDSNAVSIINVLEEIPAAGFPLVVAKFTVVITLQHEDNDPEVAVITLRADLNEQPLFENPVQLAFQGRPRWRGVINLLGLAITEAGNFRVSAHEGGRELARWDIPVRFVGQARAEVVPAEPPPADHPQQ